MNVKAVVVLEIGVSSGVNSKATVKVGLGETSG